MKIRLLITLTILFALHAPSYTQKLYFPGTEWETRKPEEMKMNSMWLDSAVSYAIHNESKMEYDLNVAILKGYGREPGFRIVGPVKKRGGPAGLIIKSGYIVAQWGDINRVDMTFSVTKSFLSTIAGIALDDGRIADINDRVNQYVWDDTFEGPHNSEITWLHLLQQTSDWSGTLFGLHDWADRPPSRGTIDDWKRRTLNQPGTSYKYNDVRVNLLAYCLLNVMREPLPVILKERIMDPIGASSTWRWYGYEDSWVNIDGIMMQSVSGGGHFGGGLFISAADQARFGLLFLREGNWNGKQLLSGQWVSSVTNTSQANRTYGYMWWTNTGTPWKGVPESVYHADGFGGNYIIIDRENDIVAVVRWIDSPRIGEFMRLVVKAAGG
ncbi:MAG: serine hydrolase [Bacteroidales bacterium]|jgi:CubicO group peptidase (beta-lactamase class C family)|nr:serine hydrolase [Bacteroidales bacterium]